MDIEFKSIEDFHEELYQLNHKYDCIIEEMTQHKEKSLYYVFLEMGKNEVLKEMEELKEFLNNYYEEKESFKSVFKEPVLDRDLDEEEDKEVIINKKSLLNTFDSEPVNVEFRVTKDREYKHLQLALEFITFMVAIVCITRIVETLLMRIL